MKGRYFLEVIRLMLGRFLALLTCIGILGATPAVPRLVPGGKPWTRAEVVHLRNAIDQLLKASVLRGAQTGLIALDVQRGTPLYSRNADQEFMPASNFKLLVGSTALARFGPNFSYITTVLADAEPVDGVERGNLYLRGGGDALLSVQNLRAAAAAVSAAGITSITGSVVTDASHFDNQRYGFGWSWDDLPYYYSPVITALELNDGVADINIVPAQTVGEQPKLITPATSAYTIVNDLTTGPRGSANTVDIVRPWGQPHTIELTGSYPLGSAISSDLAPSVPDPESYAGDMFLQALHARGITVTGGVQDGKTPAHPITLWTHSSMLMPQLLARFWYPSDNLMGELLLKELGILEAGEPGTDAHGAVVERAFLRNVGADPSTVTISDGSGLSEYDRITPRDLLDILQYDWQAPYRNIILDALPVAGIRGTLRHSFVGTPAELHVFAKTGSINHVRTISGFVQTRTHGVVVFSFLINQWMGESRPGGVQALAKLRAAVLSAIATQ